MNRILTPLAFALMAFPLAAQQTPEAERLRALEQKVEALSKELETQKVGSSFAIAGEQGAHGFAPAASKVYGTSTGLSIGGYGEMLYENFASTLENGTYSPRTNSLDFYRLIIYTGYKFNDWIVFNSEIEFEHAYAAGSQTVTKRADGAVTDVKANRPGDVEVEFAYVDFLLTKAFNVRAGMMIIPVGFINEMHEPPTYLGAARPTLERSLIPTTWRENGVGVHGAFGGAFSYRAYMVGGLDGSKFSKSGIGGGRQHGAKTVAESFAFTGRLDWNPMPGTTLGASFFTGNSNQADNTQPLATRLFDVHAEFKARGWQARGLFVRTTVGESGLPATGAVREVGTLQQGYYLELGYDLLSGRGTHHAFIPFVRQERIERQKEVALGVNPDLALSERILTVGFVYKPIPQVAVKADYNQIRNEARTGRNQVNVALGFYF